MKKVLVLAALAALVATSSLAAVVASKHDMTAGGANVVAGTTEVCVYCHTPHGANTAVTKAPLWNRDTVNAAGTTYVGTNLNMAQNATIASINQTDAPLCLSCHDGVVGNALQNVPNGATLTANGAYTFPVSATIGADLSNDHPIGFNLGANPEAADNEIKTIALIEGVLGANTFYGAAADKQMWCSSCHDVHGGGAAPFLRISNASSALCLACHTK